LIPTDNLKKIKAEFKINLERQEDKGEAIILFEGENPHYGQTIGIISYL
jgi:hypothetical protein